MPNQLLIKASVNYADEFDCEFFAVMTESDWIAHCQKVKTLFEKDGGGELEIYFGTNECLTVDDYEDWLRHLTVVEITDEQAGFLVETFGTSWGTGSSYSIDIDCILEEQLA